MVGALWVTGDPVGLLDAATILVDDTVTVIVARIATQFGGDVAAAAACVGNTLIHKPVTVIVDLIADLFTRLTAHGKTAFVDLPVTILIFPIAADFRRRFACRIAVFVDTPIAVVVDGIIAAFRLRDAGVRSTVFVDVTIAVVVDSVVANLFIGGEDLALTCPPGFVDAIPEPASALASSGSVSRTFVTGLVLPAVAGQPAAVETALIDLTVTIVVDAIAVPTCPTGFFRKSTATAAGIAQPFVDLSVTVVIDAVTHLVRCRTATATVVDQALVDLAVAIVVLTVAGLFGNRPTTPTGID